MSRVSECVIELAKPAVNYVWKKSVQAVKYAMEMSRPANEFILERARRIWEIIKSWSIDIIEALYGGMYRIQELQCRLQKCEDGKHRLEMTIESRENIIRDHEHRIKELEYNQEKMKRKLNELEKKADSLMK